MEIILPILLLTAGGSVVSEPLSAVIQRRSDAGVYASDYSHYQPVTFVAIPLHKPVPVLHILSQTPLLNSNKRRSPAYSHTYRTDHTNYAYSTNHNYVEAPPPRFKHAVSTSTQRFYNSPVYASGMTQTWYSNPRPSPSATEKSPVEPMAAKPMVLLADTDTTNDEPVILFARPNPGGGYTYRKKPPKKFGRPKKKEPVIIRIHKYRVVRDDR